MAKNIRYSLYLKRNTEERLREIQLLDVNPLERKPDNSGADCNDNDQLFKDIREEKGNHLAFQ